MFNAKLTVGFSGTKPDVVFEWADVTKAEIIIDLEAKLLKGLLKLNDLALDIVKGNLPKGTTTSPVEMTVEFLIEEDGAKWHRTVLEYPKMGEEQQAMFIGLISGEASSMSREARGKAKVKTKEKHEGKGPK